MTKSFGRRSNLLSFFISLLQSLAPLGLCSFSVFARDRRERGNLAFTLFI
jgi:hypothetical protein